ncbi:MULTISPECIES: globin domain-containing protein [unclassified Cytobacillus]|uniref:globin domain-containing protein n=1 Tax=unclassified Cytobacillus TaxID=2675268 RepID=UPI00135751F9|nr:globin [Cytobacillus sp. AMY 15.2]KAF0817026.1 Hemoglobin-like protein HbO [Bacillus sp. ZZV12-4809]MCM3090034.1 globin [Cytobacillus sp. AMY 15.2]
MQEFKTLFEELGGTETIDKLVEAFYPRVYADPVLSPLFEGDIEEIKRKQKMFLTQFLGGPPLYSQEFGPPAMKQRHLPFEITSLRAQRWLACMKEAFKATGLEQNPASVLFYDRLMQVAAIMVNSPE